MLTPDILSVLKIVPERMSAVNLRAYIEHLRDNRQKTTRYEIAFWSKLLYPLAAIVMMVLAIPFALAVGARGRRGREDRARHPARPHASTSPGASSRTWACSTTGRRCSRRACPPLIFAVVAAAGLRRAERR